MTHCPKCGRKLFFIGYGTDSDVLKEDLIIYQILECKNCDKEYRLED